MGARDQQVADDFIALMREETASVARQPDHFLANMIKALQMLPRLNTPRENARLVAALAERKARRAAKRKGGRR